MLDRLPAHIRLLDPTRARVNCAVDDCGRQLGELRYVDPASGDYGQDLLGADTAEPRQPHWRYAPPQGWHPVPVDGLIVHRQGARAARRRTQARPLPGPGLFGLPAVAECPNCRRLHDIS